MALILSSISFADTLVVKHVNVILFAVADCFLPRNNFVKFNIPAFEIKSKAFIL